MTKEELQKWLKNLKSDIGNSQHHELWHYEQAIDIVIKALSADGDTISRQAAIEAFMNATADGDKVEWCEWVLKQVPSAQPEPRWYRRNELYVRDKYSGRIHRIGDDRHDQLTIDKQGQLHYYNLQNGDGCHTGASGDGYGYEFVCNQDEYGYNCDPREVEHGC